MYLIIIANVILINLLSYYKIGLCVQFLSKEQNISAIENDHVIISCTIIGLGYRDEVVWENGTNMISYGMEILSAQKNRVTVKRLDNTYQLHIKQVQLSDEGLYSCKVTRHNNTRVHSLTVLAPPRVLIEPRVEELKLEKGETIQLTCLNWGKPKPIVFWSRSALMESNRLPDYEQISQNELLTLEEVDWSHSGTYQCTAVNDIGRPATATIDIVVFYEPVLRPDEDVIHVAIGDMTVITCFVHANPPVERMTWTHNGTVVNVTASKDIVQEVDYRSFNDNSGLLWDAWRLIIPVTPSHYLGIYSCLAATNRGTKQSFVTVSACPYNLKITSATKSTLDEEFILEWTVVPLSLHVQFDITVSNAEQVPIHVATVTSWQQPVTAVIRERLLLRHLLINTTYWISVAANNGYCVEKQSDLLQFRTSQFPVSDDILIEMKLDNGEPLPVIQQQHSNGGYRYQLKHSSLLLLMLFNRLLK